LILSRAAVFRHWRGTQATVLVINRAGCGMIDAVRKMLRSSRSGGQVACARNVPPSRFEPGTALLSGWELQLPHAKLMFCCRSGTERMRFPVAAK
jgi:hypothetical protein